MANANYIQPPSGTVAVQKIEQTGNVFTLYNGLNDTVSSYSTVGAALTQAISNLSSVEGTIQFGAGAWTFTAQYVIPSGVSVQFENGSTVGASGAFGSTLYAQFTLYPIFLLQGNCKFSGAIEVTGGTSQALLAVQNNGLVEISSSTIVTQVQVVVSTSSSASRAIIHDNIFNGGTLGFSAASSTGISDGGSYLIQDNLFMNIPASASTIMTVGSDIGTAWTASNYTALSIIGNYITAWPNNTAMDSGTNIIEIDAPTGGGLFSNNIISIGTGSGGNTGGGYTVLRQTIPGGAPFLIVGNQFRLDAGSPSSNPTAVHITSTGNTAAFHFWNNLIDARAGALGATPGGYGVVFDTTGSGTINEFICEHNEIDANFINHYLFNQGSDGTLTDGHTIRITGNYSQRCGEDCIRIETGGGAIGDVMIANNTLTDYNWSDSTSPVYAGICLNRNNTGDIYGPVILDNNSMMNSDGSQNITGIFVQGNVYQVVITGRNYAQDQTQGGTTNPTLRDNSVFGNVFTIPGTIALTPPATATATVNQTCTHATLVIAGGVVSAIAVNGTALGTVAGTVELYPLDTVTVTYTSVPTTWTYIIHGG